MEFQWQWVDRQSNCIGGCNTVRAKVFGGWIVSYDIYTKVINNGNERHIATSSIFVPDPNHEWKVD